MQNCFAVAPALRGASYGLTERPCMFPLRFCLLSLPVGRASSACRSPSQSHLCRGTQQGPVALPSALQAQQPAPARAPVSSPPIHPVPGPAASSGCAQAQQAWRPAPACAAARCPQAGQRAPAPVPSSSGRAPRPAPAPPPLSHQQAQQPALVSAPARRLWARQPAAGAAPSSHWWQMALAQRFSEAAGLHCTARALRSMADNDLQLPGLGEMVLPPRPRARSEARFCPCARQMWVLGSRAQAGRAPCPSARQAVLLARHGRRVCCHTIQILRAPSLGKIGQNLFGS